MTYVHITCLDYDMVKLYLEVILVPVLIKIQLQMHEISCCLIYTSGLNKTK